MVLSVWVLFLAAVIVVLLSGLGGRKTLRVLGTLAILAVLLIIVFAHVGRLAPVKVYQAEPVTLAKPAPTIWLPDVDDQFQADVYPSVRSAAEALGRQLARLLPTVVPNHNAPTLVQIWGRTEQGKLSREALNATADALRAAGIQDVLVEGLNSSYSLVHIEDAPAPGLENVLVEGVTRSAGGKIENTDERAVTIELSMPKYSYGRSRKLGGGVLSAQVTGRAGRLTRTSRFVQKPWVENFAAFVNSNPGSRFTVARSQSSCTSEIEAQQEATNNACYQVEALLNQMAPKRPCLPQHLKVTAADIDEQLIADRFVQSFEGAAGRIWRQALLIDTSPAKINKLLRLKTGQLRSDRVTWARLIFELLGMVLLICMVYVFLDAATRGYYTLALRIAAVVLIITAAFLILLLA